MNKTNSIHKFTAGLLFLLCLILSSETKCFAGGSVEEQIGPFNPYQIMTESKLISEFGEGYVHIEKDMDNTIIMDKKHIYYIPKQNLWLQLGMSHVLDENLERSIESILLTRQNLCDKKFIAKKPFGVLSTAHGIRIGDSIKKVTNTYGKPFELINLRDKEGSSILAEELKIKKGKVLRYSNNKEDELLFAEFYFDAKGLHSILISAEE